MCGGQILSDNATLNRHFDDCLSLTIIQETIVKETFELKLETMLCEKPLEEFCTSLFYV